MSTLRNRPLESRLHKLVRREVRRSPALKKKARSTVGRRNEAGSGAILFLLVLGFTSPLTYSQEMAAAKALLIIILTLPALWLLTLFPSLVYQSPEHFFYARLPVSNLQLFNYGWRRFLQRWCVVLLLCASMAVVACLRHSHGAWPWLWLAVWLPLQGAVLLGLVLVFQDPRPPLPIISAALWLGIVKWVNTLSRVTLGAMGLLILLGWLVRVNLPRYASDGGVQFQQWLIRVGDGLGFLLPWGWPTTMVYELGWSGQGHMALFLIPIAGCAYLGYRSLKYLRETYPGPWLDEDPLLTHFQDEVPSKEEPLQQHPGAARLADDPQGEGYFCAFPSPGQGVSALTDYILQRQFLRHHSWNFAGWLERLVLRRISPRQELVLQMLLLGLPRWSAGWRHAWWAVAVVVALLAVLPSLQLLGVILGTLIIAALAWPVLGGNWPGLAPVRNDRGGFSFISFYPVSLPEVARTIFTCNTIRMLVGSPLWLVYAGAAGWLFKLPLGMCLGIACKCILWGLAIQPSVFVFRFAQICGEDRRFPKLIKTALVLWFLLFLALTAAVFFVPVWWVDGLLLLGLSGSSWLFYLWFRRRFERMKCDWVGTAA